MHAVFLPGSGSDDDMVRRTFLSSFSDYTVLCPAPDPRRLIDDFADQLTAAAERHGPIVVGGLSLGAAIAANFAVQHQDQVRGVVVGLAPWSGYSPDSPAARSARAAATELRTDGLDAVLTRIAADVPPWLATELRRAWTAQWPDLPEALTATAEYTAPTDSDLRRLTVPMSVVAVRGDAIHPATVAQQWHAWAPLSILQSVELADFGADPALLGRAAARGLRLLI